MHFPPYNRIFESIAGVHPFCGVTTHAEVLIGIHCIFSHTFDHPTSECMCQYCMMTVVSRASLLFCVGVEKRNLANINTTSCDNGMRKKPGICIISCDCGCVVTTRGRTVSTLLHMQPYLPRLEHVIFNHE